MQEVVTGSGRLLSSSHIVAPLLHSLFLGSRLALFAGDSQLPLPIDWMFIPFVRCYNMLVTPSIPSGMARLKGKRAWLPLRETEDIVMHPVCACHGSADLLYIPGSCEKKAFLYRHLVEY